MQKHLLLSLLLATAVMPVLAQTGKKPATPKGHPAAAAVANQKPKKLRSTWGIFLSDTLSKTEVIKLLDSALVVRDEKNVRYPVISFALTYEKHEPYLNDTTGQVAVYKDYTGENFKSATLSPLWSNGLKDQLKSGDILYFDEIIVRYTGDKLYKAPPIQITVK
ncbi:hypothetical protein [Chitinophaga sp. 212800010-3]|uniref:hypothetical protein n=1 Tax=unclassified Chitinophaga TaxID=2619133 RepID=UPI002E1051EB